MKVIPMYDRIIVAPDTPEEMKGKLIIPEKFRQNRNTGVVIRTGPGQYEGEGRYVPMAVKVGMRVMWGKQAGITVGEEQLLLRETDVLAIMEEDEVDGAAKESVDGKDQAGSDAPERVRDQGGGSEPPDAAGASPVGSGRAESPAQPVADGA